MALRHAAASPTDRPHVLHAWHLSYFSGKTRAYLRYKDIDFVERPIDLLTLMWRIPRHVGARVMPVVVTPHGEWLQDTTHICETLETRFPRAPVLPATPVQRIAALLLEAWADEWWVPVAMHYRWVYPENYALFEHDAGNALLPGLPAVLRRRMAAHVAGLLRGYLPRVGVVPDQYAALERWTTTMLDYLEHHFTAQPFLFGTRPSVADFALLGPMYAHLSRDPWPARELIAPRPRLRAWVERMNAPQPQSGDFLDGDVVPATLRPLLDSVFDEFYPMLAGIRDVVAETLSTAHRPVSRLPRSLGPITFPMGAGRYRRDAMPYTLWMMQRVQDHYTSLSTADRAQVDRALCGEGGSRVAFDCGARLQRVALSVQPVPAA